MAMPINKGGRTATATTITSTPDVPKRVSMNPDSFTAGFLDDVDVTFNDVGTANLDYAQRGESTPVLAAELVDAAGAAHNQYWRAGKPEEWQADGQGFVSLIGKSGINNQSNLGMFLQSLKEAGFPMAALDDGDLTVLKGLKAHIISQVVSRPGLKRDKTQEDKEQRVVLVSKIHELPPGLGAGGAKTSASTASSAIAIGGKPNGAAKADPAGTTAATGTGTADEVDTVLIGILADAFSEGVESLARKDFNQRVMAQCVTKGVDAKTRNKYVMRGATQEFAAVAAENGYAVDGGVFKLATE